MKTVAALVSFLLCSTAALASKPDHQHIAKSLSKRFTGQATYYYVGLGACGEYSKSTDFIVAQNSAQYGGGYPGPNCFKSIRISAGGKSTVAKIMDECPTCDYGSLDMSESLFQFFNPLGVGAFPISWEYTDGSGGGGDDTPKPSPTPKPKPTTHHTTSTPPPPPPPTTTKHTTTPKPTTSTTPTTTKKVTTSTTKKTTSTTPAPTTTTTSTSSAPATTTSAAPADGNLKNLNLVILGFQNVLGVAANGN